MKKTTLILSLVILSFYGCKKDNDDTPAPAASTTPATEEIGAVPSTFTQKVLIEEFTGTWCGWCPEGAIELEEIVTANPGKVFGASVHNSDPMEIASLDTYMGTTFSVSSFPSAMVNRVPKPGATKAPMGRGDWAIQTNLRLAETAVCGLAITSSIQDNDTVVAEVHAGFNTTLTGNYKIVVYITEDEVTGTGGNWPQSNYSNSISSSPLFGLGDPIAGTYYHNHVVRKVLTANAGDVIDASDIIPGGEMVKTFKFAKGSMNENKLHVTAFVLKAGTNGVTYKIMNVQECKVGDLKNWD